MDFFFNPRSVAIVGASLNPMKFGSIIMTNLFNLDYTGAIYPVNTREEDIAGLKTYPSVKHIPHEVELVIIAIPARGTLEVMKDCAAKGVKGAVIISSGFSEAGEAGARHQRQLVDIARSAGIRIIGPNTTGILNPYDNFTTTFVWLREVRKGAVAFVAQTGMFAGMLMEWILSSEQFGISKVIGLGNKCDVDDAEALEYLAADPHTRVIMMYIESIKDGRRFMEAARATTPHKPILVLKTGRTPEGATAAMSHTGSLAGNDAIVSAALRQTGIQRVDDFQKLIDFAKMLSYQPVARGNRLAIVSLSGGAAVSSTDSAMAAGLRLAPFAPEALAEIQRHYPPWATVRHPFDIEPLTETIGFQPAFEMTARCALSNPETDLCLVVTWTPFPETGFSFDFLSRLQAEYPAKPIAFCSVGYRDHHDALFQQLESQNIPVYTSFKRAIDSLASSVAYGSYLHSIGAFDAHRDRTHTKIAENSKTLQTEPTEKHVPNDDAPQPKRCEQLVIHFDGASRGNPGPAAIGVVLADPSGKIIRELSEVIGRTTNNQAEYSAFVRALEEAKTLRARKIACFSDSELLTRQLTGRYKVRSTALMPLFEKAQKLSRTFDKFSIQHVPRAKNRRADELASQALEKARQNP
jgi:acyl-CoA synthetase (NDP forming)/ribonuclease HI